MNCNNLSRIVIIAPLGKEISAHPKDLGLMLIAPAFRELVVLAMNMRFWFLVFFFTFIFYSNLYDCCSFVRGVLLVEPSILVPYFWRSLPHSYKMGASSSLVYFCPMRHPWMRHTWSAFRFVSFVFRMVFQGGENSKTKKRKKENSIPLSDLRTLRCSI